MRPSIRFDIRSLAPLWCLVLVVSCVGCTPRLFRPTPAPSGDQAAVALRNFEVTSVDGHRAVLLRFSRLPTQLRHSSGSKPARITIQAWGPVGEGDLQERSLPQIDPQIWQVRVSRRDGGLLVVIDLQGDEPPAYTVHEMADWVMIRLTAPES